MVAPKKLWVVEKPNMATALVAGLTKAFGAKVTNQGTARTDGYYELSNGDVVSYFFGHMIEPVFLNEAQKAAKKEEFFAKILPVRVNDFEYSPKPDVKDGKPKMRDGKPVPPAQYKTLIKLFKSAKEIVNAGDIDREGQLIVDEMLEHAGIDPLGGTKPVWRLPLVSNKEDDIVKIVGALERNGDPKWVRRRLAALARQHCDAATGYNASMAYQAVTGYNRMSLGRVQTPVLYLVVKRDEEIDKFKPSNYFVPVVTLPDGTEMRWFKRAGSEGMPGFDSQGRIIDERIAREMVDKISRGLQGTISVCDSKAGKVEPPLPFSAATLASTVAKRTGMTPKEAERAAQSLYERHKAISYVGTDCQFLPQSMHTDANQTLAALARLYPQAAAGANPMLKSKAWNDSKVDEHYAIIPTGKLPTSATAEEKAVFDTVSKRFMAQFYPAHEFLRHSLAALFGQDEFRASRREVTRLGWKEVEGDQELSSRDADAADEAESDGDADRASGERMR